MSTPVERVRLAYWNNIPAPYMVDRFNALADRGVVEFEAWFCARTATDRTWGVEESSWRFNGQILPRGRCAGREVTVASDAIRRFRPDVLVSLYAEPSFMIGWHLARRWSVATAFRLLAPSEAWHPRSKIKESTKRWMFRRVDGILVPGSDACEYAASYGVTGDRLFEEPQVVDSDFFRHEVEKARVGRESFRRDLGLCGVTFVYVGRLWWGKGVQYLVKAFAKVQAVVPESSLVVVGDGPEESALRELVRTLGLRQVAFTGFRQQKQLPSVLAAADVLVLPSLGDPYGLVLDEAMSGGLAVVSTSAVGEVHARVRKRETGFVVPPADPSALAAAMLELAENPALRASLGTRGMSMMRGRTPALWAERIEAAAMELARRKQRERCRE